MITKFLFASFAAWLLLIGAAAAQQPTPDEPSVPDEQATPEEPAVPDGQPEPAAPAEFGKAASWQPPSVADVKLLLTKWLSDQKAPAEATAKFKELWPEKVEAVPPGEMLERVAASLALAHADAKAMADVCLKPREGILPPSAAWIADEQQPPLVRNNMRLVLGRWMVQNFYYDEALIVLNGLEPKDVLDPASLLFYRGVAHHWLLQKEPGLKAIGQLLEQKKTLPRRYETLAGLMQSDLEALKDDSLDHISRRMDDIRRRLELGRVGKKVRGIEDGVIASLDKLIEELEKQKEGQPGSGPGGGPPSPGGQPGDPQGTQSSSPAAKSAAAQGKGPGEINRKNIGSHSGWGDLPPKEREAALQQIGKDFPAHYRDAIEQYFRKIASDEAEAPRK